MTHPRTRRDRGRPTSFQYAAPPRSPTVEVSARVNGGSKFLEPGAGSVVRVLRAQLRQKVGEVALNIRVERKGLHALLTKRKSTKPSLKQSNAAGRREALPAAPGRKLGRPEWGSPCWGSNEAGFEKGRSPFGKMFPARVSRSETLAAQRRHLLLCRAVHRASTSPRTRCMHRSTTTTRHDAAEEQVLGPHPHDTTKKWPALAGHFLVVSCGW